VSESCQYDRVKDRDQPELERPKRPSEAVKVKVVTAAKKGRAQTSRAQPSAFSLTR